jgi:hypothetical protein
MKHDLPRWNPRDREGHPYCDRQPGNGEWLVNILKELDSERKAETEAATATGVTDE